IALLNALNPFFVLFLQRLDLFLNALLQRRDNRNRLLIVHFDLQQVVIAESLEAGSIELISLVCQYLAATGDLLSSLLPVNKVQDAVAVFLAENSDLVIEVFLERSDLVRFDFERSQILFNTPSREDLDVNYSPFDTRRSVKRRVLHFACLFAKDGT